MQSAVSNLNQKVVSLLKSHPALIGFNCGSIALIAVWIEVSGGLPSQYAHLYYVPVIVSALTLPRWPSLGIALLAALAVSPAIDLIHLGLGRPQFFPNPAPWTLTPDGWIVRPLAFVAISAIGQLLGKARSATETATKVAESRSEELSVLGRIDRLILAGADEDQAIHEIARLVSELTSAKVAGIVTPIGSEKQKQEVRGFTRDGEASRFVDRTDLPYGEGVSGWALQHGRTTTSQNALKDGRYDAIQEMTKGLNQRASAAAPIILDGVILGALRIGYEEERDFSTLELATLERLANQAAVAIMNTRQRQALRELALETATVLTDVIEARDPYTGQHSARLVVYSRLIAEALSLGSEEIRTLSLGAAMHDVGKIAVPDSILLKPGKLTPEEYDKMKQHSTAGGAICSRVPFLQTVYPIVYHHHERFDGLGYPDGLAGESIPLGARIVAIADAYDAMTSDRVYRRALPSSRVEAILRNGAGTQWDPKLIQAFFDVVWPQLQAKSAA
jgi:HD-GYP domain-containing protein (c-di-GMP phosphodiesterase class II)